MQTSLAMTAIMMGLTGGPHCVAMCGAACGALGQTAAANTQNWRSMGLFQFGRLVGYASLGALAAASLQGVGWLTVQSAALRPLWSFFHVMCIALGLTLLWLGRQPLWLEGGARKLWRTAQGWMRRSGTSAPLFMGLMWALLPCGLLYSALLVASLTNSAVDGAMVMGLFALGSAVSLQLGPTLWLKLRGYPGAEGWGIRLAGLALTAFSGWALWMGLVHNTAPWCATP